MPVLNNGRNKPDWVNWSNCGFAEVNDAEGFDLHFHDADEYWIVFSGKARVLSEGKEYIIGSGDVLCTRMGDEHDILENIEAPLRTFWFEDELKGQKRPGHLHRSG